MAASSNRLVRFLTTWDRKKIIIASTIAGAVIIAGIGTGARIAAHDRSVLAQAQEQCRQAATRASKAEASLDHAAKDAQAVNGLLGDKTVVKASTMSLPSCPAKGDATAYRKTASRLTKTGSSLTAEASKIGKDSLSEADKALDRKLADARKLASDSNGKADDQKTIDSLNQAIEKAGGAKTAREKAQAVKTLGDAMSRVSASVSARQAKDAQAAQAQSSGSTGSGYTGYSTRRSYTTQRQYTAPSRPYQGPARQPAQTNNGSGNNKPSSGGYVFVPRVDPSHGSNPFVG